jgi:hypothetical protein
MPAPVVLVRREEVHRAPLPFRASRRLSEKLGHALIHAHADRECVTMVAVGGDHVIIIAEQRAGADRDRLLPDVKMQEATHRTFVVLILVERLLLEAANSHHVAEQPQLIFGEELLVIGAPA